MIGLQFLLNSCLDLRSLPPDLPGRLVVYRPYEKRFYEYREHHDRLVDQLLPEGAFQDSYDPTYDPRMSPDGNWRLEYDANQDRYVVSGLGRRFVFKYFCFSPGQITWSPDSQFIAYRADHDEGEWSGRIMIMSLTEGQTWWIGAGDGPRWYAR